MTRIFSPIEFKRIRSSALFDGFSSSEVVEQLVVLGARRLSVGAGAVVAEETAEPTQMGIVLSGFLHVYDSAFKGVRHLVRIVRPGEIIGATLVAPPTAGLVPAMVTAFGPCVIATLSLAAVRLQMRRGGGGRLFANLTTVVREELQASWRKISILSCANIAERVLLHLQLISSRERSKTFAIGSTEAEFADYLGVSSAALSRTLRKLAKEGLFTYRRDVFTLF